MVSVVTFFFLRIEIDGLSGSAINLKIDGFSFVEVRKLCACD